ncbi:hypothetical protein NDU88_005738 [Pleurodeles waltl]|uniref:Uncharacterized protein n=1 Tax=Pleurodeles waltl TaxID=8319 RepID=A0AAV7MAX9_PLEWA|nr:hypothetical protein NDU88_005738 [Pleurodeles waltl]
MTSLRPAPAAFQQTQSDSAHFQCLLEDASTPRGTIRFQHGLSCVAGWTLQSRPDQPVGREVLPQGGAAVWSEPACEERAGKTVYASSQWLRLYIRMKTGILALVPIGGKIGSSACRL